MNVDSTLSVERQCRALREDEASNSDEQGKAPARSKHLVFTVSLFEATGSSLPAPNFAGSTRFFPRIAALFVGHACSTSMRTFRWTMTRRPRWKSRNTGYVEVQTEMWRQVENTPYMAHAPGSYEPYNHFVRPNRFRASSTRPILVTAIRVYFSLQSPARCTSGMPSRSCFLHVGKVNGPTSRLHSGALPALPTARMYVQSRHNRDP